MEKEHRGGYTEEENARSLVRVIVAGEPHTKVKVVERLC